MQTSTSFRLLFVLQRCQVVTEVLDAALRGILIVIVLEQRPPRGHHTRSVGRNAGRKTKDPSDIFVWKLPTVTLSQCGEIRGWYAKRSLDRAVALRIGSMTRGAILLIYQSAGRHIVRWKLAFILSRLILGDCHGDCQKHNCKQSCAVRGHNLSRC